MKIELTTAPANTEEVWRYIACRYCGERIAANELAKHEAECAQREHPTKDKFE